MSVFLGARILSERRNIQKKEGMVGGEKAPFGGGLDMEELVNP